MALAPFAMRIRHSAAHRAYLPLTRASIQRRYATTDPPKLVGPMDNAFNRDRLAVKQHAAQSAGELPELSKFFRNIDLLLTMQIDLWRKLCI